jgi:myo-inositol-1(or 4)-monophosphatase
MSPEELARRFAALTRIARQAGDLARSYFENLGALSIESKGVQDYVSVADRATEDFIKKAITAEFPGDDTFGEESGGRSGDATWVIDPIDGTHNFLRGYPHYGVSIAFMSQGVVEAGAVYDPSLDALYAARRGSGASCNGKKLAVSRQTSLDRSIVCVGFSHSSPLPEFLRLFSQIVERRCEFRRIGSAALGLAHVAAGHFDAFWQAHLHSWDVLAGMLLVQEAGGWTNDFLADDGLTEGNLMLASGPGIAGELRSILGVTSSSDRSR